MVQEGLLFCSWGCGAAGRETWNCLLVVAAARLSIKATRGREAASSSHCLIVVSSLRGSQVYTLLPFLFGQTEDLTLIVKGC